MSVFANGMEVSGKATPNKTIAAMPDVCLSPPPPPAGPVPLPYPMTGMASDTTDGCTSVIVKGKEAGKKNSTKYSKTMGNEPATNSFGANILTHKLSSSLKFAAYSFDVIFEGGGACRFSDLTTQNHMNAGGGSVGMSAASAAAGMGPGENPCAKLDEANKAVRSDMAQKGKEAGATKSTITHGVFTPKGGPSSVVRACSNKAESAYLAGMSQGLTPHPGDGPSTQKKSKACGGHTYKQAKATKRPHTSHTEARIIEDLFKAQPSPAAGGTLVLAIDWKTARPKSKRQHACKHCQKLLCKVGGSGDEACMTIKVCVKAARGEESKPVDVKDLYCKKGAPHAAR